VAHTSDVGTATMMVVSMERSLRIMLGGMMYIPSFMKIHQMFQKLLQDEHTDIMILHISSLPFLVSIYHRLIIIPIGISFMQRIPDTDKYRCDSLYICAESR
jgi:hypothetical protein